MTRMQTLALAAVFGVAAAACEAGDVEDTPEAAETFGEQPATPTGDQPASGAGAGATLAIDSLGGSAYLTDGQGRALYMLEGEPADSSTCYDECAREWPPLLASGGAPRAGAAPVQGNLISTIERRDGQRQVTYAGHALHYYHEDQGPGQTTGQDLTDQWGEWYLVTPSGEHLEAQGQGQGQPSGS